MKVTLDTHEMFYLLESCLRGSHLRSGTILRFVDEWYTLFTPKERSALYDWTLRLVYNGEFKPFSSACGADIVFMPRYNPDNQYLITLSNGINTMIIDAFKMENGYWIDSKKRCPEDNITGVEKL